MSDPAYPAGEASRFPIQLMLWAESDVELRQNRNALITTNPLAFLAFYGVRAATNRHLRNQAFRRAQPQWRTLGQGTVGIDERGIELAGPWGVRRFTYGELYGWERWNDALILRIDNPGPLLLQSPAIEALAQCFGARSAGRLWQAPVPEVWGAPPADRFSAWEQRDGRFTFGIPHGWWPFDEPGYMNRTAADLAEGGHRLLFMLSRELDQHDVFIEVSEVADPELSALIASSPDFFIRNNVSLLAGRASKFSGAVTEPPRTVLMGDVPAAMLSWHGYVPGFRVAVAEFWAWHGSPFMLEFNVTSREDSTAAFVGLLPEVQMMVASWQWR